MSDSVGLSWWGSASKSRSVTKSASSKRLALAIILPSRSHNQGASVKDQFVLAPQNIVVADHAFGAFGKAGQHIQPKRQLSGKER